MSATLEKRTSFAPAAPEFGEQSHQIAALNQQVIHLTSVVQKLDKFIGSADLMLGDYELTAGEILTLENRIKQDIAKSRKDGAIKPFDGDLESLVAA